MHHPDPITAETLQAFTDAWNRHDVGALMSFMTDGCLFQTAAGPLACGTRHQGRDAVRTALAQAWAACPDAQWRDGRIAGKNAFRKDRPALQA